MVDAQIIENWLNKADNDLAFAKANLKEDLEFYPQICFYLHQSVEKALQVAEQIRNFVKSKLSEPLL